MGNSLGVIIPSEIIEERGFHRRDIIQVAIPPSEPEKKKSVYVFHINVVSFPRFKGYCLLEIRKISNNSPLYDFQSNIVRLINVQ